MIIAVTQNAHFDGAPSQIFFSRPLIQSGIVDRQRPCVTVPTQKVRLLLGEELQRQSNIIKVKFFNALRQSSETCQAAGIIFENWFFCFFSAARTIQCNWVQGSGVPSLEGTTNLLPTSWAMVEIAPPPYFWIAPKGFPGIDSALILKTGIYV